MLLRASEFRIWDIKSNQFYSGITFTTEIYRVWGPNYCQTQNILFISNPVERRSWRIEALQHDTCASTDDWTKEHGIRWVGVSWKDEDGDVNKTRMKSCNTRDLKRHKLTPGSREWRNLGSGRFYSPIPIPLTNLQPLPPPLETLTTPSLVLHRGNQSWIVEKNVCAWPVVAPRFVLSQPLSFASYEGRETWIRGNFRVEKDSEGKSFSSTRGGRKRDIGG